MLCEKWLQASCCSLEFCTHPMSGKTLLHELWDRNRPKMAQNGQEIDLNRKSVYLHVFPNVHLCASLCTLNNFQLRLGTQSNIWLLMYGMDSP